MKWSFLPLMIPTVLSKVVWLQLHRDRFVMRWPNFVHTGHIRCFPNWNYITVGYIRNFMVPLWYLHSIYLHFRSSIAPFISKRVDWECTYIYIYKNTRIKGIATYVMHNTEGLLHVLALLGPKKWIFWCKNHKGLDRMESHPCSELGIWCKTCLHYLATLDPNI